MRALVLSDIHANIAALDAVLAAAPAVDEIWHLGDVVGYGPEPDAVVARLGELGALGVRGNHDAAAVGGDEIESFNVDARRAMEWTRAAISDGTRAWLERLPERLVRDDWTLVHGSPRDPIWEYVTSTPVARAAFADLRHDARPPRPHAHADRLPRGGRRARHHEPGLGLRPRAGRAPGAAQPRQRGPAARRDPDGRVAGPRHRRRQRRHGTGPPTTWPSVQAAMEAAGLPPRLVERLSYGL